MKRLLLTWLLLACAAAAAAQEYPAITQLSRSDLVYRQLEESIEASYRSEAGAGPMPELVIYAYDAPEGAELFSLASRLNLPYEALSSLNRLERAAAFGKGRVLVPSLPGVFVPERPDSDLECLSAARREGIAASARRIVARLGGKAQTFLFFPGDRYHPAERAFFLGALFRFPLPKARLTSGFGMRTSPISGKYSMHSGIDLAAPAGTEVYAAREGLVTASGLDPVLGQYVTISHEGGWETVYGHLSKRLVGLNERVYSGMMIGAVGSTGLSTGPHLHFEVRRRGEARNPETLVPRGYP